MTTPAQEAAVRNTVGNILMSDSCQRIDFRWGMYRVDGWGYTAAALTLLARPGTPRRMRVAIGGLAAGQGAAYNAETNTLRVPFESYGLAEPDERSRLVHEATHIRMDMLGRGHVTPGAT